MLFKVKPVSSMTKVMPWAKAPDERDFLTASALRGEVFSFQAAYYADTHFFDINCEVESSLGDAVGLRQVGLVPVELLCREFDDNVISRAPGLYPDPLLPMPDKLTAYPFQWRSVWVSVRVPEDCPGGKYPITIKFSQETEEIAEQFTFTLEVLPLSLPEQQCERTEWFYADCISSLHNTPVWSNRHWKLLENYFRNMADHGITQLLTPVFTPPLDTAVGTERPTVQLVDVTLTENGYEFDFERLERWIKLAQNCGLRRFEFSHLYTQWGAKHAPKIIVRHNGVDEKMFGWDTEAMGKEYQDFLAEFLRALVSLIDRLGLRRNCCFHVSDEPGIDALDNYRHAAEVIKSHLGDIEVMDAMSHLEFYNEGLCKHPIPSIAKVEKFVDSGIEDLWTYYCCNPTTLTTNRFIHYPGARTRILGVQLYNYDLKGFLHWGYNFWYRQFSLGVIDPYKVTDAGGRFPCGDAFLVYPGENGPVDSLRHELMREAMQDLRAMQLLESHAGRANVMSLIEEVTGGKLSVNSYPQSAEVLLNLRQSINRKLQNA
jgi:hypothetical protein